MTADLKRSLDPLLRRIDARLETLLPPALAGQDILETAMRDSVLAPGKRLRPLMTAIAAEDLGGSLDSGIEAGCAVEMVHAASLILDDLPCMDDAELRRGRPALHRGHGEDVAILAAIAVLSRAYGVLAALEDVPAEGRLACVGILSATVGAQGLVAGQFQDLRGGRGPRRVQDIAAANGLKTGALFSAALEIGGVVADADRPVRDKLRAFAGELGLAFQLLDDLLDGAPSAAPIGKDVGKDKNKSTIVSLVGRASVERHIERHVATANRHLTDVFGGASRLHALVDTIFQGSPKDRAAGDPAERGALEQEVGVR